MNKVEKTKCKHDNAWHVDECEGDENFDIFECKDCGEYLIVEKLYHDWDNASVIPKHHYDEYNLSDPTPFKRKETPWDSGWFLDPNNKEGSYDPFFIDPN